MKKITLLVIMSLLPLLGFSQFPENFDGGVFPPAGWVVANNGVGTVQSWVGNSTPTFPRSAPTAAFCNSETIPVGSVSEDWLISPYVTIPNNGQLRFWLRQLFTGNQYTKIKVYINQTAANQMNLGTYTLVKTFTEIDLGENDNLTYFEHFVDLLPYSNQQAYIAIVREFDRNVSVPASVTAGDRILLDDLTLVEKCLDPTGLNAINVTTNQAQLTWNNVSGSTQWDIELVNVTLGETPNFAAPDYPNITANNSFIATPLQPDTNYNYYIRARCTNGFNSEWIGPLNFSTRPLGSSCATPLPITTLPYAHTSNTLLYSDTIDTAPACVGGNYLNGNEVIYQFTPDFTGNIILTMTPEGATIDTGVFIYNGSNCGNITGGNCLTGVANNTNAVREITFAVTNGTPYYIVISSDGSPQTFGYTLIIQRLNCLPPNNLQFVSATQNSATFTWGITGGATSWEYVIQAPGLGIPTGSGITVNPATNSVTDTSLNPSTPYEFYVRADCNDGTFSPWAGPIAFNTLCGAIPVPFTEGFNSTSPTQFCWTVTSNSGANTWNMDYTLNPSEGNQSASILLNGATNDDWLISPQLTLNGNQRLRFRYRTETTTNHNFEVKLSAATTAPADFTSTLVAQTNYNNTTYLEKIVNMNGVTGDVFIGWHVAPGANGTRIYIDNVIVEDIPPCPNPLDIVVNGVGPNSATLSWTPGNTETSWQVAFVPTGAPAPTVPTAGETANTNVNFTNAVTVLNPVTTYDVYVLANCGANGTSAWVGPVTFTTTQVPGTVPYVDGFEATPQWSVVNGTQTNRWTIGTAVNNGGTSSLYVTNDGGTSNAYSVASTSTVHVYRDITIPTGITNLNLAFDWRNEGEGAGASANDYFSVWLVPTTFEPTPGTQITALAGTRVKVGSNFSLNPAFITQNITVPATTIPGPIWRLVFEWRNNASLGGQPPAAIDNINLTVLTCPAPSNLSASAITTNTAELNWNAGGTETLWDIVVQPICSGTPTASSPIIENQTRPYTATALADGTSYEFYVRSDCSGDNSHWVGPFVFNTLQVPAVLNYTDGFENVSKWTFNNGTQINKWIVGDAVNNGGTKSLYVSNTRCAENSNTYSLGVTSVVQAYRDFDVPAGVDLLSLSFDWRSVGETNDYFRVWVVPATFTPNPGAQITAGAGRVNVSGSLSGSAAFRSQNYLIPSTAFAGQTMRLVFEWRNDANNAGAQQPAAIDNINLSIVTCPPPTGLGVVSTAATSAELTWTPVGPATQWEVYAVPFGGSAPGPGTTGVTVNALPAQITGLEPGTHYTYYVRSICSTSDVGPWTQTGFDFYTKPINDECTDATLVPVNTDIYCTQVVPGILTFATASSQPSGCPGVDDDVWFQFVATNSYLTVALRDIVGVAPGAMTMSFYGGSCSGLTPLAGTPACVSNANAQTTLNGLVVGQVYYIRVFSNATTPQVVNFNVCITTPSTCSNSTSICTVQPYTYGNTTQVANLGSIGCLGTSPNPTFFTIQIAQNGPIAFQMVQTSTATGAGLDVDYAAWGPFTNQSLACANLPNASGTFAPPINLNPVVGGSAQDYGCSYSVLSVEEFIIPNAQAGEIYILLITNFSNQPGTITLTQTNLSQPGAGQTLCCPSADFSYNPVQYCKGVSANPVATISTGSVAGTFSCISSNSADLVFANTATGEIDLAASQPGTYLIKNDTTGAAGTCAGREDYFTIVINAPQSAVISYPDSTPLTPGSEFCQSAGPQPVTVTGDQDGFFSLVGPNQIGLSINTDTGEINPSQSQPGTYTVNYYFLGSNSCAAAPITYDITIYPSPVLNPVVTQPNCPVPFGTVVLAANPNYEYSSDNGATYGTSNTFANLTPGTNYTFAVRDLTNGCVTTMPIVINPVPANPLVPEATPAPATCTGNGSITITAPASGNRIYTDLFISEVYDKGTGSLSFVEIYNGTGAPVDLRNYKLRFYTVPATPTIPTANCDFALGVGANFMLANNATWVVKVSSDSVVGTGVIPNQNASLCAGVNVDDRIELTTLTNVLIDIWGVDNFVPFTPGGQPGYTYRRLNTVNAPSTTWNPLDWDAIDPEVTINIGQYTPQSYTYTYSIDGVDVPFNEAIPRPYSPTPYTVTVTDPSTGCTSSIQVSIANPAPFADPILNMVSPASCNANPNATVEVTNPMGAGYDYYVNGVLNTDPLNAISLPASTTPYVISVVETATGCSTSASITINAPAAVTAPALNIVAAATCNNGQTATVEVTNPAGAGFTYYINGTAYAGALNNIQLAAGTTPYVIEVRDDATGCNASETITIDAAPIPGTPTFDATATVQPTCDTPTGTIVVLTPAEGTGFEYAVNGGAYQASATFTGLAAGTTHTVTVRDLTTGCVSLPGSLPLDAVPSAVTLSKLEECRNGAYTLEVTPNNSDFDYEWTNASGTVISTSNTAVVTEIGLYTVTVTTDEGCVSTVDFDVTSTICNIQKGISPNNDGSNDEFDLTEFNVRKLSIFNRYGVVVYEHGAGYTDQWHGQSKGGETLPDGTYYYVIEAGNGQSITGWVYINKER